MSYTIEISEAQRVLLFTLLAANRTVIAYHQAQENDLEFHNLDPDALIKMFNELPQNAANFTPYTVHGFCL